MSKFKVGEILEIHGCISCPEFNGEECTVLVEDGLHDCIDAQGRFCQVYGYLIGMRAGHFIVQGELLRRKRPPSTDKGEQRIIGLFTKAVLPEMEPA